MTADESFVKSLEENCGVSRGDHVLAAVSGGADSVALLTLLHRAKSRLDLTVSCAHAEHGLRGAASLEDMEFVRSLCGRLDIAFYAKRLDVAAYAKEHGGGLEAAARTLRHAFLQETAAQCGADVIALAHHAMDQAETVLLHASRGSDLRGLCAMRWRRGNVIRPLLGCMPDQLRAVLQAQGIPWREDETNADVMFARNRIRHEALPALTAAYPGAVQALCRLADAAQRDERHFDALLDALPLTALPLVDGLALDRETLSRLDDALLSRAIARAVEGAGLGAQRAQVIEDIVAAVRKGGGAAVNLEQGAHVYAGKAFLCIVREQEPPEDIVLRVPGETKTPYGVFTVRPAQAGETGDGVCAQAADAETLRGSAVSMRRAGDAMIPFGRHHAVLLKKLMIDAGVERPVRNSLPVIRKGEDILWAVGLRPSELCRAQSGERMMVEFKSTMNNTHVQL